MTFQTGQGGQCSTRPSVRKVTHRCVENAAFVRDDGSLEQGGGPFVNSPRDGRSGSPLRKERLAGVCEVAIARAPIEGGEAIILSSVDGNEGVGGTVIVMAKRVIVMAKRA